MVTMCRGTQHLTFNLYTPYNSYLDLNYVCRGTESMNKLLKLTQLCQAA